MRVSSSFVRILGAVFLALAAASEAGCQTGANSTGDVGISVHWETSIVVPGQIKESKS